MESENARHKAARTKPKLSLENTISDKEIWKVILS